MQIPYTREHNDRSFYLKLVASMGRYIYGVFYSWGNISRVLFSIAYMYVLLKSKQSHRAISVFSPSLPRLLCVSEHLSNFSLYFSHRTVHIHKGFLSHHQEPRRLHVQILRHQSPFPPCMLSRHHPAWEPKYGQAVHNLASSSYDDTYT